VSPWLSQAIDLGGRDSSGVANRKIRLQFGRPQQGQPLIRAISCHLMMAWETLVLRLRGPYA